MEMLQLPVGGFKSCFSEALDIVARGGTVCVTYGLKRKPVAVLSPLHTKLLSESLVCWQGKSISRFPAIGSFRTKSFRNHEVTLGYLLFALGAPGAR